MGVLLLFGGQVSLIDDLVHVPVQTVQHSPEHTRHVGDLYGMVSASNFAQIPQLHFIYSCDSHAGDLREWVLHC